MHRADDTVTEQHPDDAAEHTCSTTAPCGRVVRHPRRTVLRGVAVVGGVGVLAACGGGSDDTGSGSASDSDDATDEATDEATDGSSSAAPTGTELGASSEVQVGGGQIYKDQKVVVTQPTEGDFKAFTAVCTHQGCLVSEVTSEAIVCSCHNSEFSLEDGSVLDGPAPDPLAAKQITVTGGTITLA